MLFCAKVNLMLDVKSRMKIRSEEDKIKQRSIFNLSSMTLWQVLMTLVNNG